MRISPATMEGSSILLELAASDDLVSFKRSVEVDKVPVDVPAAWYGRWSSSLPTFELRTPLMVAALYGSVSVLQYILSNPTCPRDFDVSRHCGTDCSTALHLAVAGGSKGSAKVVKLLLDAGADVNAVDSVGNKAVDLIPRRNSSLVGKTKSAGKFCLGGGDLSLKEEEEEVVGSPVTPKQNQVSPGGEKKEYPVDVTLPDIKSGIYGTDEFRMYTFKVKPCSRAYSHDWTECPFVHPGENARRRDPRKYHYSCVPCPDFRKGSCRNGDACEYAHGVFESWLHPAQYRTRLCNDEIGCNRRVCFFAHKPEELRPLYNSSGSPGSVASSPRSTLNLPPLDLNAAAAAILMNQAPMSPSSSAALAAAVWLKQNAGSVVTTPTAQLHTSRLKSALSARDMDLELELLALDGFHHHHHRQQLKQQKLIDEITSDLLGSPDTNLMSPLKNLSLMKQSAAVSQFPSPSTLQKQLLSSYTTSGSNFRSSPPVPRSSSPSFGVDNNSIPSSLINSRASAFAKRSQSFIDRGALNRQPMNSQNAPANKSPLAGFSNWGSSSGKLDWRIHGEELNKLRKSASFGIRANGTNIGGGAPGFSAPANADEPNSSWLQPIGKGYDVNRQIHQQQQQQEKITMMMNKKQQQFNLNSSADEFHPGDIFASSWSDQICFEQEQLVA